MAPRNNSHHWLYRTPAEYFAHYSTQHPNRGAFTTFGLQLFIFDLNGKLLLLSPQDAGRGGSMGWSTPNFEVCAGEEIARHTLSDLVLRKILRHAIEERTLIGLQFLDFISNSPTPSVELPRKICLDLILSVSDSNLEKRSTINFPEKHKGFQWIGSNKEVASLRLVGVQAEQIERAIQLHQLYRSQQEYILHADRPALRTLYLHTIFSSVQVREVENMEDIAFGYIAIKRNAPVSGLVLLEANEATLREAGHQKHEIIFNPKLLSVGEFGVDSYRVVGMFGAQGVSLLGGLPLEQLALRGGRVELDWLQRTRMTSIGSVDPSKEDFKRLYKGDKVEAEAAL